MDVRITNVRNVILLLRTKDWNWTWQTGPSCFNFNDPNHHLWPPRNVNIILFSSLISGSSSLFCCFRLFGTISCLDKSLFWLETTSLSNINCCLVKIKLSIIPQSKWSKLSLRLSWPTTFSIKVQQVSNWFRFADDRSSQLLPRATIGQDKRISMKSHLQHLASAAAPFSFWLG